MLGGVRRVELLHPIPISIYLGGRLIGLRTFLKGGVHQDLDLILVIGIQGTKELNIRSISLLKEAKHAFLDGCIEHVFVYHNFIIGC